MLSLNASLAEFIDCIAELPYDDIILLADQEATAAERRCCKRRTAGGKGQNGQMESYALLLKDFMIYMRHGVATSALRQAHGQALTELPRN
jgi:hypothetical protein